MRAMPISIFYAKAPFIYIMRSLKVLVLLLAGRKGVFTSHQRAEKCTIHAFAPWTTCGSDFSVIRENEILLLVNRKF